MREGLELPHQCGVLRQSFEIFQPRQRHASQHTALQVVFHFFQAMSPGFVDEAGKIDVRGQIALAEVFQHVSVRAVVLVAAQRAFGTRTGEKLLRVKAVVGDEDGTTKRRMSQFANPREHGEVDFQRVAGFKVTRQVFRLPSQFRAGKIAGDKAKRLRAVFLDIQLTPAFAAPTYEMRGKGIRQLIAEKKGMLGAGSQRGEVFHPLHAVAESFRLRFAITRIRLHDEVGHRFVAKGAQNVLGELPLMRALLDDGEILRLAERPPFLKSAHGQQFAEQRADAHTGEKIALPADPPRSGAIITMPRMVERQLHDLCEGQPPSRGGG